MMCISYKIGGGSVRPWLRNIAVRGGGVKSWLRLITEGVKNAKNLIMKYVTDPLVGV